MKPAVLAFCFVTVVAVAANSAPVPPAPKELTAPMLVGEWHYSWGSLDDGAIWFFSDGTYTAQHIRPSGPLHVGTWKVEGNALVIREWMHNPDSPRTGCGNEYRMVFEVKDYPCLIGTCGSVRVVLKHPKR